MSDDPYETGKDAGHRMARAAQDHWLRLQVPIRQACYALGWAVAVHGSLIRDIDIVLVPWTDDAADPTEVLAGIAAVCVATVGVGRWCRDVPTAKPHGRIAWAITLPGGTWLDVSVMPRAGVEVGR